MKPELVGTVMLGGLAALDATPVAQTLLSQPLVTATVLGLLWGDLPLAIGVGVVLQILAASTLPLGSRTPEDYAAGGVVGAGVALALGAQAPYEYWRQSAMLVGAFAGMLAAVGGVPLIKWQRRRNEGLSRWCEQALRGGDEGALGRAHAAAVALAFGVGVAYCAVAIAVVLLLMKGPVVSESMRLARGWELLQPLWLGFGFAQLLHAFVQRRLTRAAVFGASLVGAWLVLVMEWMR